MAVGDIYRGLSRNQNLQPAIESVKKIVQSNRKRQMMDQLTSALQEVDNFGATPSLNYEPDPQQRYMKSGNLVNKSFMDALNQGADKEDISPYMALAQDKLNLMKPPPADNSLFQADPYKELYKGGELVRGAKDKPVQSKMDLDTELSIKNKYAKDLIDYKGKKDKVTKNDETLIDRSKLRGEISKGIQQIKNLKKQLYTGDTKTGLVDPTTITDKEGNESQVFPVIDSQGVKNFESPEQFTKYKEAVKVEYLPKLQELITKSGLDGALPIIRKGIQMKKMDPEEAIKQFAKANKLSQDDIQDLTNWFTLLGL